MLRFVLILSALTSAPAPEAAPPPASAAAVPAAAPPLTRSARDGRWSAPTTWEGGQVPGPGARVQVREGHAVVYDVASDAVVRSIHVAGRLSFDPERDTRLVVGLIKVQPGDDATEEGFDCAAHAPATDPNRPRPTLEVGTPGRPIPAGRSATVRLAFVEGLDPTSCPAIVACGGRLEFHGAPLGRTWVKLAQTAGRGDDVILVRKDEVAGWKPGDRVILTGTTRQFGYKGTRTTSVAERPATEERLIRGFRDHSEFGDALMTLDRPLDQEHRASGEYRAEVANLSRNVVVESADPGGVRGHTMYHRNSAGSVSYAEFRHLGKEGVLGRYALHFHLAGETMRGSSVVGASFWDSKNRWITIHGTHYLVVRDCVGYKSVGHGFFLEDGTETRNVFDRNLAVQALRGKPLPDQVLPYDQNLGSGFWWANSLNSFTRNVAAECDQDGYRFEVFASERFNPVLPVLQPDGTHARVDIRTLPFLRFDGNEAHCHRFFGLNLGGFNDGVVPPYGPNDSKAIEDVDGVGPDDRHPFVIRGLKVWDTHWPFHAGSPSVYIDGLDLADSEYGIWRSVMDHHEYHNVRMERIKTMSVFFPRPGRAKRDDRVAFLRRVDDLPPSTVITHVGTGPDGAVVVRGTTADNGTVRRVVVNGREARALAANFAEWDVTLEGTSPGGVSLVAGAEDVAGNVESRPHRREFAPATAGRGPRPRTEGPARVLTDASR